MARFIVLKGNPNSGKTYTMWMVYHMLSCLSKDAKVKHEFKLGEESWHSFYEPNPIAFNDCNATDFMAKLNINGQKIGMISEGDEVKPLENKINELMNNKDIVRNRKKIVAAIGNAKIYMDIQKEFGSFSNYIWKFTNGNIIKNHDNQVKTTSQLSDRISKDLYQRGMRFVGSTIIYSYLQAIGVIDDHEIDCLKY